MLEDRDYMRQPEFGEHRWGLGFRLRWTWTLALVAVYVAVLLAQQIINRFFPGQSFIFNYLALSPQGLAHGYVWQLLTYQFMHAGWLHLILNCWAIIVFGSELESLLGGRRYLALMFSSGIVGGIFQVLIGLLWPTVFGGSVVGASACAFGLVAAFALIFPERELTMLIFFVIPFRLRAKTLLLVSLVVALLGIFFPWDNVANAAHLGGMAMGWFYVKGILKNPALLGVAEEARYYRAPAAVERVEKSAGEFAEGDVDAVLDKISARGINSLTARERAILEAARKKMAQR
jgi:membrane associated rhomboid family serine protease